MKLTNTRFEKHYDKRFNLYTSLLHILKPQNYECIHPHTVEFVYALRGKWVYWSTLWNGFEPKFSEMVTDIARPRMNFRTIVVTYSSPFSLPITKTLYSTKMWLTFVYIRESYSKSHIFFKIFNFINQTLIFLFFRLKIW